jgi:hypothetical protein
MFVIVPVVLLRDWVVNGTEPTVGVAAALLYVIVIESLWAHVWLTVTRFAVIDEIDGAHEVPDEFATVTKPGFAPLVFCGVVQPVPVGTRTDTREPAEKSLATGAVNVKISELPVEPAMTELGETAMVPSPLTAVPAFTLNGLLVANVRLPSVAVSVYPLPTRLTLQPANVATPALAVFGFAVQARAAPAVPVPLVIARLTALASLVTVLPNASWTVTAGWVPNAVPAVFGVLGCVVKASFDAAAAVMLNVLLVAPVRPELVKERV